MFRKNLAITVLFQILACGSEEVPGDGEFFPGIGEKARDMYPADGHQPDCAIDQTRCGDECVNTSADVRNCGWCENACAPDLVCSYGACVSTCDKGLTDCDKYCADLQTDAIHCGQCGNSCSSAANGATECIEGMCAIVSCNSGFGDCDSTYINGCETDLNIDASNCGSCGNVCPNPAYAGRTCADGVCGFSCNTGYANCDSNSANGCETYLSTDASDCGSCENACSYPNASAYCSSGICAMSTCNTGFGNCDINSANGCETDTRVDASNCGSCGNICTAANGTAGCASAACTVSSCNTGYADCNRGARDGCETDLAVDVFNCGSCGNGCPYPTAGTRFCAEGACGISCNTGYADCNSNPTNGCETNLNTNTSNCGACGNVCSYANAGAYCSSGICAMSTCNTGFGNCDINSANGCETDTRVNTSNCGSCGTVCASGTGCYRSICQPNGYTFGACRTEGCSATLSASCGAHMENFSSWNEIASADIQECLGFPGLPNGARVRISFDYDAAASTCFDNPSLNIGGGLAVFFFPDCSNWGSSYLDFTLPSDQNNFNLLVFSGDWCASVRITSIVQF